MGTSYSHTTAHAMRSGMWFWVLLCVMCYVTGCVHHPTGNCYLWTTKGSGLTLQLCLLHFAYICGRVCSILHRIIAYSMCSVCRNGHGGGCIHIVPSGTNHHSFSDLPFLLHPVLMNALRKWVGSLHYAHSFQMYCIYMHVQQLT